ncbi:MAG TPA: molybdenum cofactor guanylyltransferase [Bacteroidales bacterium]|nr:molybdenum cofactor guanylyltransferase [Bacteroidales bacterium]
MTGPDVTGIVLAGGESSRMGQDKSLMLFRDQPLICYAIDSLQPVCRKVVISSNKAVYDFTGCEVWPDEMSVNAPMIGIYTCLRRSESEWNLVLSCDMPLVDTRLLEFLLTGCIDTDLVVPDHDGNCVEPLCGVYNKRLIPLLEKLIHVQDYSLMHLIREARSRLIVIGTELAFYRPNMFLNVNTIEDFRLLNPDGVPRRGG